MWILYFNSLDGEINFHLIASTCLRKIYINTQMPQKIPTPALKQGASYDGRISPVCLELIFDDNGNIQYKIREYDQKRTQHLFLFWGVGF